MRRTRNANTAQRTSAKAPSKRTKTSPYFASTSASADTKGAECSGPSQARRSKRNATVTGVSNEQATANSRKANRKSPKPPSTSKRAVQPAGAKSSKKAKISSPSSSETDVKSDASSESDWDEEKTKKSATSRRKRAQKRKPDAPKVTKRAKTVMGSKKVVTPKAEEASDDSDSGDDWEAVEEASDGNFLSGNSLEINLHADDGESKKKKGVDPFEQELRRKRAELQRSIHKTHFLCMLAHGLHLSTAVCNDTTLQAVLLSLVPPGYMNRAVSSSAAALDDRRFVARLSKWFSSAFPLRRHDGGTDAQSRPNFAVAALLECVHSSCVEEEKQAALLFVALLRALGFDARVVLVFDLLPVRPSVATSSASGSKSRVSPKPQRESEKKPKQPRSVWTEICVNEHDDGVQRWISADPVTGEVDEPRLVVGERKVEQLLYVMAFDNDGSVKDVTMRYLSARFGSSMVTLRRNRADSKWLDTTLRPFASKFSRRDRAEEIELHNDLMQHPLPTAISEYKNHPLYVLKRDLLKFEALYPPETKPIGFVKNEEVYPRSAVYTLHSKDTWLKEAREIREGEKAYKVVKGRPRPKKAMFVGDVCKQEERTVEVFGFWQTQKFVPRKAENGIVPRNEHGNVSLFRAEMLPVGTVHLRLPGIVKTATRLEIDCAPAMIGWDFKGGMNFPVFDGGVVCEEHKELLVDAWRKEQELGREREAKKREERAIGNWKRFVKAVLLRERLKFKFRRNFASCAVREDEEVEAGSSESLLPLTTNADEGQDATSKAWPQCRREFMFEDEKQK